MYRNRITFNYWEFIVMYEEMNDVSVSRSWSEAREAATRADHRRRRRRTHRNKQQHGQSHIKCVILLRYKIVGSYYISGYSHGAEAVHRGVFSRRESGTHADVVYGGLIEYHY